MSRNLLRVLAPLRRATLAEKLAFQPARSILSLRRAHPSQLTSVDAIDDAFRQMDRQLRDMNNLMQSMGMARPAWISGLLRPSVESELSSEEKGAPSKYTLNIDVGEDIPPENIKIIMKDRVMTIEGKVEHKSEDGTSRVYQEIMRKFTLPENINLKEVTSFLTPEGILKIEAPLPESEAPKAKEIPIESHEALESGGKAK